MSGRAIHKFEIYYGPATVYMDAEAEILHVDTQPVGPNSEGVFCWALVDPNAPRPAREIGYFATGEYIPPGSVYIGTALSGDRAFVWHVFENAATHPAFKDNPQQREAGR